MSEYGDCTLTRLADGRLLVERADPRIRVSADLLEEIRSGQHHPDATLDNDVLTIRGSNRTVIYRMSDKVRNPSGAEWYEAELSEPCPSAPA